MKFTLYNKCKLEGIPKELIEELGKKLTISNPVFGKKMGLDLSVWGIPQFLYFYQKIDSGLIFPIGAYQEIKDLLIQLGYNVEQFEVADRRKTIKNDYFSTLKFTGELRGYQEVTKNICMENTNGVVDSMTGSGKTVIFVSLVINRKQPTLILVNTIELANQTISKFVQFTNIKEEDIGFVGSGKFNIKPVTVGLHQTMARLSEEQYKEINNNFGMVIADEVHILPAKTHFETMGKLTAKYKFGFSATPKREDGLTPLIHWATGPTIYTVPKEELTDVLIKPSYTSVETKYTYPLFSSSEYQFLIRDLSENTKRNNLIRDYWTAHYKGKSTIMLCLRLSQLFELKKLFPNNSILLHSKLKKAERKEAMERIISGEPEIILSTYGLFSTGIDIPRLEVLMLCAPMRSEIKLKQAAGRLMRMCEGKTGASIVDFVDIDIDLLKYQFYKRKNIFKKL